MPPDGAPEGPALDSSLRRACDALQLEVSLPQQAALLAYLGLLRKWNATYNLTAVRQPDRMLTHHIVDSLCVVAPLRRHLQTATVRHVADAGSGAGLPGAVLALMCPDFHVTCVDSVGKKVAFVRQVAAEVPIPNLRAVHSRLERLREPRSEVITSRAFATLADMVEATRHLLAREGVWLAMKGKLPTSEIAALPADVEMFHVERLSVPGLDAERCLVWLRHKAAL
ncbi:MAG: 16S rRNA (guanine(527)-N(7))-methyltransferase RsmG [Burkholderiaceae bacterium]